MAWISFPNLLPTYFVKEALLSLASAVGTPLHLDLATVNKTRPSCAKGRNMDECHVLHPEFAYNKFGDNKDDDYHNKKAVMENNKKERGYKDHAARRVNGGKQVSGCFPRVLTRGKVVGNPQDWNEVTNKRSKAKGNNGEK